jgi:hypothetical protein
MVDGPGLLVGSPWSMFGGEFTEISCKLVNVITEFNIKLVNRTEFLTFEYDFKIVKRSD